MIATLNVHFSRFSDLERPDCLKTTPSMPIEGYRDSFGNWCSRLVAPAGCFSLGTEAIVRDPGAPPDKVELNALQHQIQPLPTETLLFLLGSAESEAKRPPIPTESGHPIRGKAATQSDRRRPPLWIG
jgi:hypothetical protein